MLLSRLPFLASVLVAQAFSTTAQNSRQIVLVEPDMVTRTAPGQWKQEGFNAVAVVLDEGTANGTYRDVGQRISDAGLELYLWIEVARNLRMATLHPRWMASLGMHEDWQKNFPKHPEPAIGEVAKAFPWVPIGYRETFDAHLDRIEQLLKRAPEGWKALLLNDLQGGPSSCGCGNVLCRWAIDYHVRSTATKLEGDDIAAKFVNEVRNRAGGKTVIPVWTTECEDVDLPAKHNHGKPGTGLCGTVGCALGACPKDFTKQWSAVLTRHSGPMGLLALHSGLQRTQPEFGGGPTWVTNAIGYLNRTLPAHGGKPIAADRLWLVVEGNVAAARDLASKAGVGAVIAARAKIDQSYEPKSVRAE